jgi:hypothetical protein
MCAAIFMGRRIFSPRVAPLRGKSCFQSSPVRRRGCLKAGHHKEQFMEIRKVPISLLNTHEGRMQLIGIIIGQYLLKACLALLDTPFFYFFTRNADRR